MLAPLGAAAASGAPKASTSTAAESTPARLAGDGLWRVIPVRRLSVSMPYPPVAV
jgi:hypothetical protein